MASSKQGSPDILFETLRTEFGQDIGITIVNLEVIESEMTQGDYLSDVGFRKSIMRIIKHS